MLRRQFHALQIDPENRTRRRARRVVVVSVSGAGGESEKNFRCLRATERALRVRLDQLSWCTVYTCSNGKSTPVPFLRCFEPSGLCLAPRC